MKSQNLFSGKSMKSIPKCLLKFLSSMQSAKRKKILPAWEQIHVLFLLANMNNVHGELLYYPRCCRRHPQMLKFSVNFLRPHYFLTISPI